MLSRAITLCALLTLGCEGERQPAPAPAPPSATRPAPRVPERIPSSAFVGGWHDAWAFPGPDGSADRCVEIIRSWQWANDSNPLLEPWYGPRIDVPEGEAVQVGRCESYIKRWSGSCVIERPDVEAEWGAPPEVEAEEQETRLYVGRARAREGRAACEADGGEWSGRGRWRR